MVNWHRSIKRKKKDRAIKWFPEKNDVWLAGIDLCASDTEKVLTECSGHPRYFSAGLWRCDSQPDSSIAVKFLGEVNYRTVTLTSAVHFAQGVR